MKGKSIYISCAFLLFLGLGNTLFIKAEYVDTWREKMGYLFLFIAGMELIYISLLRILKNWRKGN